MTTATATLADWLLQRIADDEVVAQAAVTVGQPWQVMSDDEGGVVFAKRGNHTWSIASSDYGPHAAHMARHDPARVLADCAARRAIVEMCERNVRDVNQGWIDNILRHLAAPYASSPGYDPAWAVS